MEARKQREGKLYSMGCARRKPNICIRRMIKRKIRRDTIEDRKCTGDKKWLSLEKFLVDILVPCQRQVFFSSWYNYYKGATIQCVFIKAIITEKGWKEWLFSCCDCVVVSRSCRIMRTEILLFVNKKYMIGVK